MPLYSAPIELDPAVLITTPVLYMPFSRLTGLPPFNESNHPITDFSSKRIAYAYATHLSNTLPTRSRTNSSSRLFSSRHRSNRSPYLEFQSIPPSNQPILIVPSTKKKPPLNTSIYSGMYAHYQQPLSFGEGEGLLLIGRGRTMVSGSFGFILLCRIKGYGKGRGRG